MGNVLRRNNICGNGKAVNEKTPSETSSTHDKITEDNVKVKEGDEIKDENGSLKSDENLMELEQALIQVLNLFKLLLTYFLSNYLIVELN